MQSVDIGKEICDILGLDSNKTKNITIEIKAEDVIMVTIQQYLQEQEYIQLKDVLKTYKNDTSSKEEDCRNNPN